MKEIRILLLAFLMPLMGCSDILDQKPTSMLPMEGAIESVEDCQSFLVGVYSVFKNTAGIAVYGTLAPDVQTDLVLLVQGNQQSLSTFHNWTFTSQASEISSLWSAYYGAIFRANYLLQGIEDVRAALTVKSEGASESVKKEIAEQIFTLDDCRAQACMARAFCRVELVKLFADAYDPENASTQLALPLWNEAVVGTPERTTMDKYYEAILADLKVAEGIANKKVDNIYFSRGAVKALEARVHLYTHNWKEAIKAATSVIEDYGYELLNGWNTADRPLDSDYAKMWLNDAGKEIIWKIGYTSTDETLGSLGGSFCGLDGSGKFYPEYMPAISLLQMYDEYDSRSQIFFSEEIPTNYSHGLSISAFQKYPGNTALNYTAGVNRYVNMPKVFRLSEIYLIRAEAYYWDKQEGLADDDLTALRQKRIKNYGNSYSGPQLYQEIQKERIKELCMEGHRLYDLKRYGVGFERRAQEGGVPASYGISATPDNPRFTWPIPKSELDVPHSKMVGNPSNLL